MKYLAAILMFIFFGCGSQINVKSLSGLSNRGENSNSSELADSIIDSHSEISTTIDSNSPEIDLSFSNSNQSQGYVWSCHYDQVHDDAVVSGANCSSLSGLTFNSETGHLSWVPSPSLNGDYELKISFMSDGVEYSQIFQLTINFNSLEVASMFANHPNWNDYVKWADKSLAVFNQSDTTCDPSVDIGYNTCLHAGERKRLTISWLDSCENLSFSDELNLFNWNCSVYNGEVVIYSLGLKTEYGLSDLIEYDSGSGDYVFKNNSLRIYRGDELYAQSSSTKWWSNPILEAPSTAMGVHTISADPSEIGRIYVISGDVTGYGYEILDDKTSILTFGDSSSFKSSGVNSCELSSSSQVSADKECMLFGSGVNFIWIEGFYDNDNNTSTIMFSFNNTNFSTFRKIKNINISSGGHSMMNGTSHSNRFINVKMRGNNGASSSFYSADNTVSNFLFYENIYAYAGNTTSSLGFDPEGSNHVLSKIKVSHVGARNGYHGALSISGQGVIATNILVHNSLGDGIFFGTTGDESILAFASVFNSAEDGIFLRNSGNDNFIHNVLSVGNDVGLGTHGSQLSENHIISDIALFENEIAAANIYLRNTTFTGFFAVGNNAGTTSSADDCIVIGGTNPGLINGTCTDSGSHLSSTYTGQTSDALFLTDKDISSSIVGKVTVTDSENTKDSNGLQAYDGDNDFFNFENWYRSLGKDGGAFPSTDNKGSCDSLDCRIWDFRLLSNDSYFLNKSDDGVNNNGTFQEGVTCPSAVNGNKVLTNSNSSSPITFLKNAGEIFFDDIGNDNGLCESNEACIYHPNIGAYQGEGALSEGVCLFENGTVSNVSMYRYMQNGAP